MPEEFYPVNLTPELEEQVGKTTPKLWRTVRGWRKCPVFDMIDTN